MQTWLPLALASIALLSNLPPTVAPPPSDGRDPIESENDDSFHPQRSSYAAQTRSPTIYNDPNLGDKWRIFFEHGAGISPFSTSRLTAIAIFSDDDAPEGVSFHSLDRGRTNLPFAQKSDRIKTVDGGFVNLIVFGSIHARCYVEFLCKNFASSGGLPDGYAIFVAADISYANRGKFLVILSFVFFVIFVF